MHARYEISRGLLWNWRSQVRLPGSVRFNCTPDLAISVKVRIRLLMLAFWDIGVRASEGPASGFCLLAGIRRSEFALRPLCRPSWPLRGPALQRYPALRRCRSVVQVSLDTRQRRKAAGEAQGAREPAEILGSDGVFQRAHPRVIRRTAQAASAALNSRPSGSQTSRPIIPIAPHSPNGLAMTHDANWEARFPTAQAADMAQLPPICGAEMNKTGVKRVANGVNCVNPGSSGACGRS